MSVAKVSRVLGGLARGCATLTLVWSLAGCGCGCTLGSGYRIESPNDSATICANAQRVVRSFYRAADRGDCAVLGKLYPHIRDRMSCARFLKHLREQRVTWVGVKTREELGRVYTDRRICKRIYHVQGCRLDVQLMRKGNPRRTPMDVTWSNGQPRISFDTSRPSTQHGAD